MTRTRRDTAGRVQHRVRRLPRFVLAGALTLGSLYPSSAAGKPQVSVGVEPAIAYMTERGFAFFGALTVDTLFLRERPSDHGLGPRVELATFAFDDLRLSLGPTALLAASPIDLQPSLSALVRVNEGQTSAGLAGRLFAGFRPYNPTHPYAFAVGLSAGADYLVWGSETEQLYVLALHLDAMWLSLPFVALVSAF